MVPGIVLKKKEDKSFIGRSISECHEVSNVLCTQRESNSHHPDRNRDTLSHVHPEGIELSSLVPKTSTLSVELWVL